jgi:hypothetical protein
MTMEERKLDSACAEMTLAVTQGLAPLPTFPRQHALPWFDRLTMR